MSFFGAKMKDPAGNTVRTNFDSFSLALITTFQITTTENWPEILHTAIANTSYAASIFFILVICVCTYVLVRRCLQFRLSRSWSSLWQLSLFLAIMLSFFGELTPSDKRIARLRWRLSIRFVRTANAT